MNLPTDRNARLQVLTHRDELDPDNLQGWVVVVLDVIFATTTMIAAFDRGIRDLYRSAEHDGVFCYTFFKAVATRPV